MNMIHTVKSHGSHEVKSFVKTWIILNNRATVWSRSVNFPASARHAFLFTLVRFIKRLHCDMFNLRVLSGHS